MVTHILSIFVKMLKNLIPRYCPLMYENQSISLFINNDFPFIFLISLAKTD